MASQDDNTTATATASSSLSSSSSSPPPSFAKRIRRLRALRYAFATRIAKHAHAILKAARALQAVERDMHREARRIAGNNYKNTHVISFDMHGSIDDQLENVGEVEYGAGLEDIIAKAKEMADEADSTAGRAKPPLLPYEEEYW